MADALADTLQEILGAGQYTDVATALDEAELESSNPHVLDQSWPHALHLLGHIHNGNLEDARFLWKRIPEDVKQGNPELEAVWRLLQYCWNKHYQGTWSALQGYQWSPQARPLVDAIMVRTRQQVLDLLTRAYSLISPAKAASLLGMGEAEVVAAAQAAGWQLSEAAGPGGASMLVPKRLPQEEAEGAAVDLQQLSQYMLHLEGS